VYDDPAEGGAERPTLLPVNDEPYHAAKERVVAHFEKEYFARLVARAGGNMSKAARLAGVDRTTLYRLMDKHQVPRDERGGEGE
jgi:DNA-binding NtrC family response regulator